MLNDFAKSPPQPGEEIYLKNPNKDRGYDSERAEVLRVEGGVITVKQRLVFAPCQPRTYQSRL